MKINELEKLPKMLPGTVHAQWVRCGKKGCHCREDRGHGLYYYLFWREAGRLRKQYLKSSEVAEVRARCQARQQHRRALAVSKRSAQAIVTRLRELEPR